MYRNTAEWVLWTGDDGQPRVAQKHAVAADGRTVVNLGAGGFLALGLSRELRLFEARYDALSALNG